MEFFGGYLHAGKGAAYGLGRYYLEKAGWKLENGLNTGKL
jgi:hypothetical protein